MSREIKFQFIYKGMPFSSENPHFNWHKKTYTLNQLLNKPLSELSDIHDSCELVVKRQYTGLKDSNGVEIYEGDFLAHGRKSKVIVTWNKKTCAFACSSSVEEEPYCDHLYGGDLTRVIGNIYETPELLND